MELSDRELAALQALLDAPDTPVDVRMRARIVLLRARGRTRGKIAEQCGVSLPTVDRWVSRYREQGIAGLIGRPRARAQVPEHVRGRLLELAASVPPAATGLAYWTTRTLADYLRQTEDVTVSNNYVATVLRQAGIRLTTTAEHQKPHGRQPEPLDVHFELVVVDGPPAHALTERQAAAIRDILRWLRDHPDEPEAGASA